jgi:hypothetical protein
MKIKEVLWGLLRYCVLKYRTGSATMAGAVMPVHFSIAEYKKKLCWYSGQLIIVV